MCAGSVRACDKEAVYVRQGGYTVQRKVSGETHRLKKRGQGAQHGSQCRATSSLSADNEDENVALEGTGADRSNARARGNSSETRTDFGIDARERLHAHPRDPIPPSG
eukprot:108865-Pleurochrysis_carterae.AAC.3